MKERMPKLPKLILETPDFDLINHIFSRGNNLVAVDGKVVNSYDEFVRLCSEETYRGKEFLRISLFPIADGG